MQISSEGAGVILSAADDGMTAAHPPGSIRITTTDGATEDDQPPPAPSSLHPSPVAALLLDNLMPTTRVSKR